MTTPNKISMIFAGENHTAKYVDGTETQVRVRAMPARHLGRVLQLAIDEPGLLEFVCLVPAAADAQPDTGGVTVFANEQAGWAPVGMSWADNLDDDSHAKLLEAAKRLNFTRAAAWGERQIEAKQFQAPLILKADKALAPMVQEMAALLVSALPQSVLPGAFPTKSSTASPSTS